MVILALQRCDRCSKDKKGCSRELNGCQRCQSKNIQCHYTRKNKKCNKFTKGQEFIEKIQFFSNNEINKNEMNKNNKNNRDIGFINNNQNWLPLFQDLDRDILKVPNNTIKSLIKNFKLRSTYNVISTLMGSNLFDEAAIHTKITEDIYKQFITILTTESIKLPKNFHQFNEANETWLMEFIPIMEQAKRCYFKYINSNIPLFLESTFETRKRSKYLMAAIYACGLKFMKPSKFSLILNDYCQLLLLKKLSQIDYQPTLETLQIIILIYQGLKSTRILCELIEIRFECFAHLAYQLGLHNFNLKYQNYQISLERKLCYCALIHISVIRLISYNFPSPFHSYLYDNTINLISHCIKLTNNSNDIKAMLNVESNYHKSMIYIKFNERNKTITNDYKKNEQITKIYIKKLQFEYKKIIIKYNNLKLKKIIIINDKEDIFFIQNIKLSYSICFLLIYRYLLLQAQASFDTPFYPNRIKTCQNNIEFIASEILNHILKIPTEDIMYLNYGIMCFTLSIVYFHIEKYSLDTYTLIKKCLILIEKGGQNPVLQSSSPPLKNIVYQIINLKKKLSTLNIEHLFTEY